MVELFALESGRAAPRRSADADALAEAKAAGSRPRQMAEWLVANGFELDGISPEGVGHRFKKDAVIIDVLAPDNLGPFADLTTLHGAHTVAVPGGRQALNRTSTVDVACGELEAALPRPDLGGALVIKSRAVVVDDAPASQRLDIGYLYSLVADPEALRKSLTRSDMKVLRSRVELANPSHEAWLALGELASDAHLTFRLVTGL